jgi:hypothetical protein
MMSKQCVLIKGKGESKAQAPFSKTDAPMFCKQINSDAYNWALANATPTTAARFRKYGQQMTFGDDEQKAGGPLFIDAHVSYKSVKQNNTSVLQIKSPMMKTDIDYWKNTFHIPRPKAIPDPGCFHYCKVMTPARAMEWLYTDGLRLNRSIKQSEEKTNMRLTNLMSFKCPDLLKMRSQNVINSLDMKKANGLF